MDDRETRPEFGIPVKDNQRAAALDELLFRLARLLGRQAAEDHIRERRAANDNHPDGGMIGRA